VKVVKYVRNSVMHWGRLYSENSSSQHSFPGYILL